MSTADVEGTGISADGGADDTLVDEQDERAAGVARTGTPLERGQTLGRYVVLSKLGVGGMGIVYEAYDPELDRKLALKLLHPLRSGKGGPTKAAEQRMRLLREAQAMARLTHPNVITVHDVGTHDEGVFVAMEFVDGETLTAWLERRPQWPQVVDVLVRAAKGLAAAHEAGLIHRDFKPDNVMVGNDGRVLVMDFGLARGAGEADEPMEDSAADSLTTGSTGVLNTDLTRAGAIMGTPAYMAPEQHVGLSADAKSDQFSFCVSLWEGLYGERPFAGESPAVLAMHTNEGSIREPPRDSDVPGWVRRIAERGMSPAPESRWPSMIALVRELRRDPGRARRRRLVWSLGIVSVLGAGYGISEGLGADEAVCARAASQLSGVWDREAKKRVREALLSTGRGYAEASWRAVEQSLDAYAEAWVESHTAACEATWVRGEQSQHVLDLRMQCLDSRRASLRSLAELLSSADDEVLEHAAAAAEAIPSVARCDDVALLSSQVPPPAPGEQARSVAEIREQIDQARALETAGKFPEGLEVALAANEAAATAAYAPALAEARLQLALLVRENGEYDRAAAHIVEAIEVSEGAGHDELRADAWRHYVATVGEHQGEPARALELLPIAEAAARRLGDGQKHRLGDLALLRASLLRRVDRLEEAAEAFRAALEAHDSAHADESLDAVRLRAGLGGVLARQGKHEAALEQLQRGLAIEEEQLGPEHPKLADILGSIGRTLGDMGRDDESITYHRRALEIRRTSLGPEHPRTASAHSALGNRLEQMGRFEEALVELHTALSIKERTLGDDHLDLAATHNSLGNAYHNMDRQEDALRHLRRALEINTRYLGEEHATIAFNRQNIGNVLKSKGDYEAAEAAYQQALDVKRKVLGPRHHSTGGTTHNMADLLMKKGEFQRAQSLFEEALAIKREALGDDHPRLGSTLTGLGELNLMRGRPEVALTYLEEALRIREKHATASKSLAGTRFFTAQALWLSGGDRERAIGLAQLARGATLALGDSQAGELARIETWLARHRT